MSFKTLVYAYVLGGFTFIPLALIAAIFWTFYTSVPVNQDATTEAKPVKECVLGVNDLEHPDRSLSEDESTPPQQQQQTRLDTNDLPKPRKGWLTMRRTFEESTLDGGYVTLVRSFLDSRSKDPKRSKPKDMWYVALKGKVLYLYEDEEMTECEAAVELGSHDVIVYPEGLLDGELFTRRNAICLRPKTGKAGDGDAPSDQEKGLPSVSKAMKLADDEQDLSNMDMATAAEIQKQRELQREQASDASTPWFIFVRNCTEMEDWYLALLHASVHPAQTPTLSPLQPIFDPVDMNHLVSTLDEQPDIIPMRWLNALLGRIFFSYYRTNNLEAYIIGRLMRKLSKVKRPNFLTEINVTEVSVGNKVPMLSKPMLKELTREGDASLEVHLHYKGEIRITIEATAVINLGARFKSYTVRLVLAAVLKELEGNLLIKVKRPPSNRIWYAFTHMPKMVLSVEPIVSDRQITWSMILSTIESKLKEIIQESVVLPNMDDIAFFESSPYALRGGIYADASRKERESPSVDAAPTSEDEPTIAMETAIPTPADMETASAPIPRTQSAEDVASDSGAEFPPLRPAATVPLDDTSTSTRRRTWFSSSRPDELGAFSAKETHATDDPQRGRTVNTGTASSSSASPSPTPPLSDDSHSRKSQSPDATPERLATPSMDTLSARRLSVPDNLKEQSSSWKSGETSHPQAAVTTRDASSSASTSSATTGFLSTLKSKAADKQAFKETAKEAVKKWAVWNSLNSLRSKDSNGSIASNPSSPVTTTGHFAGSARNSEQYQSADVSDQEAGSSRPRSRYSEVRAAVAQREKERIESMGSDTEGSWSSLSPTDLGPGHRQLNGKSRAVSGPSSLMASYSTDSSTSYSENESGSPPNNASHLPSTSTSPPKPSSASWATPNERDSHDGMPSRPAPAAAARFLPPEFEGDGIPKPNYAPIQSQPQAKMMMIPGIHASHRNDVMSIGYVAPTPQPPQSSTPNNTMTPTMMGSSVANAMMGKPAIQSVYRLWNKGAAAPGGSQPQQRPGEVDSDLSSPSLSGQSSFSDGLSGAQKDVISLPPTAMTAPSMAAPKLEPPPLPPRSAPVPASTSAPSMQHGEMSDSEEELPQAVVITPLPLASTSAEAALKSIVTKDSLSRASIDKGSGEPSQPQNPEPGLPQPQDETAMESDAPMPIPIQPTPARRSSQPPPPLPPRRPQVAQA